MSTKQITLVPRMELSEPEQRARLNMLSNVYPAVKGDINMLAMIYDYCVQLQLDPMSKPVHPVPMPVNKNGQTVWETVIMPGIVTYRIAASRTGVYLGHSPVSYGPDQSINFTSHKNNNKNQFALTVPSFVEMTVYRAVGGVKAEYPVRQYWTENYGTDGTKPWECIEGTLPAPNAMWKKRIVDQLVKCCESQALRHAFPEVCTGYTVEEMEGKEVLDMGNADQVNESTSSSDDDIMRPQAKQTQAIQGEVISKTSEATPAPIVNFTAASQRQIDTIRNRLDICDVSEDQLFAEFRINSWSQLPADKVKEASKYVRSQA